MSQEQKIKRKRWSRAMAEEYLLAYARSGLSKKEFCIKEGLKPERLEWWAKRNARTGQDPQPDAVKFVSVSVCKPQEPADNRIEIVLKNGRSLRVTSQFDPQALTAIVAIMEQTC